MLETVNWPRYFPFSDVSTSLDISIEDLRILLFPPIDEGNPRGVKSLLESRSTHLGIKIKILKYPHLLAKERTTKGHKHRGVFCSEDIEVGEFLGEYTGQMQIFSPEIVQRDVKREYGWKIEHPHFVLCIDASLGGNILAFVNDYRGIAEECNVVACFVAFQGLHYFGFKSVKRIKKGEELLIDYGEEFF